MTSRADDVTRDGVKTNAFEEFPFIRVMQNESQRDSARERKSHDTVSARHREWKDVGKEDFDFDVTRETRDETTTAAKLRDEIASLKIQVVERKRENDELRNELRDERTRSMKREEEFRAELRAVAAKCASLASISSAAAAMGSFNANVEDGDGDGRDLRDLRDLSANASASASARRTREANASASGERDDVNASRPKSFAWEVGGRGKGEANGGYVDAREGRRERGRERGREPFVGDLSAFFFKTAKHDVPVWSTKGDDADGDARAVGASERERRTSRGDAEEFEEDFEEDFASREQRKGKSEGVEYPSFASASALTIDIPENLPDLDDEDGDLVSDLLAGGEQGERAAEILAARLRAVGFDLHDSPIV